MRYLHLKSSHPRPLNTTSDHHRTLALHPDLELGPQDPNAVLEKYGADALRLYLINSPVVAAETLKFREEGVLGVVRDIFLPW